MGELKMLEAVPDLPRKLWPPVVGPWTELSLPLAVSATWAEFPVRGVKMSMQLTGEKYQVVTLTLNGGPITASTLRSTPIQSLAEQAVQEVVGWKRDLPRLNRHGVPASQGLEDGEEVGPSLRGLAMAAAWYRYGNALGVPPVELVKDVFGVSLATGGLWVRRAKDRGFFDHSRTWDHPPTQDDFPFGGR